MKKATHNDQHETTVSDINQIISNVSEILSAGPDSIAISALLNFVALNENPKSSPHLRNPPLSSEQDNMKPLVDCLQMTIEAISKREEEKNNSADPSMSIARRRRRPQQFLEEFALLLLKTLKILSRRVIILFIQSIQKFQAFLWTEGKKN